jgi:hypothetical protein
VYVVMDGGMDVKDVVKQDRDEDYVNIMLWGPFHVPSSASGANIEHIATIERH